jgi:hypothetical protein
VAVVGGLMLSQLLTLYITPVVYITMDQITGLFRRKPKPDRHDQEPPADSTSDAELPALAAAE